MALRRGLHLASPTSVPLSDGAPRLPHVSARKGHVLDYMQPAPLATLPSETRLLMLLLQLPAITFLPAALLCFPASPCTEALTKRQCI